jgi:hypothetical protein
MINVNWVFLYHMYLLLNTNWSVAYLFAGVIVWSIYVDAEHYLPKLVLVTFYYYIQINNDSLYVIAIYIFTTRQGRSGPVFSQGLVSGLVSKKARLAK